jgi:predicted permease
MEIFFKSIEAVLILIGLGFFGFYLLFKKYINQDVLKFLSPIAIEFAVPAMIFVDVIKNFDPYKMSDWWIYPLIWLFTFIYGVFLAYIFSFLLKKEYKKEFFLSLIYPNAIFIPVVLISSLSKDSGELLIKLYLFTLFFPILLFNFYTVFYSKGKIKIDLKKIFNPIFISTILGIFIKYYKFEIFIPDFFLDILRRIGAMSIPIILLIIGGNIYLEFKKKSKIIWKEVLYFVIVKNILFPLAYFLVLLGFNVSTELKFLIVLQAAVPPVTVIPILIEREGGNSEVANQFLFFSFVFSIISLPSVLYFFNFLIKN